MRFGIQRMRSNFRLQLCKCKRIEKPVLVGARLGKSISSYPLIRPSCARLLDRSIDRSVDSFSAPSSFQQNNRRSNWPLEPQRTHWLELEPKQLLGHFHVLFHFVRAKVTTIWPSGRSSKLTWPHGRQISHFISWLGRIQAHYYQSKCKVEVRAGSGQEECAQTSLTRL